MTIDTERRNGSRILLGTSRLDLDASQLQFDNIAGFKEYEFEIIATIQTGGAFSRMTFNEISTSYDVERIGTQPLSVTDNFAFVPGGSNLDDEFVIKGTIFQTPRGLYLISSAFIHDSPHVSMEFNNISGILDTETILNSIEFFTNSGNVLANSEITVWGIIK